MNIIARLFFLLVAIPALLLGIVWGAAVTADFAKLNWTQRLVELGISSAALAVFVGCVYGFRRIGKEKATKDIAAAMEMERLEASSRLLVYLILLLPAFVALFAFAAYAGWLKGNMPIFLGSLACEGMLIAFALEALRQVLVPGPMLLIDGNGLRHANYGFIDWGSVVGMRHFVAHVNHSSVEILKLGVRHPHRFLANAGWPTRLGNFRTLRDKPEYGVIDIPLKALSVSPEVIVASARAKRARVSPPPLSHWHESFTPRQMEDARQLDEFTRSVEALGENPSLEDLSKFDAQLATSLPAIEAAGKSMADHAAKQARNARWAMLGLTALFLLYLALKFAILFGLLGTQK